MCARPKHVEHLDAAPYSAIQMHLARLQPPRPRLAMLRRYGRVVLATAVIGDNDLTVAWLWRNVHSSSLPSAKKSQVGCADYAWANASYSRMLSGRIVSAAWAWGLMRYSVPRRACSRSTAWNRA